MKLPLLLFLFNGFTGFAQNLEEGEKIASDRPGFGDAVSVLPLRDIHIETGTWFEQDRRDSLLTSGWGINSTLFRAGIFRKTELRMDYNLWNSRTPAVNSSETGLYPFRAGLKYHLVYNKGIVPAITFIGMQEFPFTASTNFRPKYPGTDLQLSFANKVNESFALCYNLGSILNFSAEAPVFYYAFAAEFTLTGKLGCYVQSHGTYQDIAEVGAATVTSRFLNHVESGLMFYPTHNMQLDLSGGFQALENTGGRYIRNKEVAWFFVSAGFSWRFQLRSKGNDTPAPY